MFARTERLLLRPGWSQDAPALFEAIGDERIVRNLATAPWPYRLADAEAFLATERKASEPSLLIFRRTGAAPELIGGIGFGRARPARASSAIGSRAGTGGGAMPPRPGRALLATARHGLRLKRLDAGHFLDNPASGRVLEKLGFQPDRNDRPPLQRRPGRDGSLPTVRARARTGGGDRPGDGGLRGMFPPRARSGRNEEPPLPAPVPSMPFSPSAGGKRMKSLFINTAGGKAGAVDGLNLFFGALLGANLGTLDRLRLFEYVKLHPARRNRHGA